MKSEVSRMISDECRHIAQWSLDEVRRIVLDAVGDSDVRVVLFGSRARQDNLTFSDIDVAFDARGAAVGNAILTRARYECEESSIPYTVDIVDIAEASEDLRERVLREGVVWKS